MQTLKKIWMNGKIIKWNDAKIHVLTHTLHYGAGVFEGIRFYETVACPAVFRLDEHIDRLFYSASAIEMKIPFSKKDLKKAILDLISVNKIKSGYIRPLCFYGYGKMGLNPTGAPVDSVIALWPWGSYLGEKAIKVKVTKFIRIHPSSVIADAKVCGYYANSIFASLEVHSKGYNEALFLDYKGNVAEGPGENIFMVKKGALYTPSEGSILPGITRDSIMKIAKKEGIKVIEKRITVKELKSADELFFTGTAAEISPIGSIDKIKIGKGKIGPITSRLKAIFSNIVSGKDDRYKKWLSYVK